MNIKKLLLSTVAALGLLAALAPAHADPHRGARQHAESRHKYVYYPSRQVYYAPETRNWFWLSGGNWQVGATLPAAVRIEPAHGVQIILSSGRPYAEHVYVERNYGRPWRSKHGYGDRERHQHRVYHRDHQRQHQHNHRHMHKQKHKEKHAHHGRGRGHDRD